MADTKHEVELSSAPTDPVSGLAWDPSSSSSLLVSSWDKSVRLYDTSKDELLQTFQHPAAVLDATFVDGQLGASGALDRRVRLLNLETGQTNVIGKHDDAVKCVKYSNVANTLVTGSWDRTVRTFDPRSPSTSQTAVLQHPDKVFAMDVVNDKIVVAMGGRHVWIWDVRKIGKEGEQEPMQRRESSLKFMIRDVKAMPSGEGYATSSVEGRVAVEFFDPSPEAQAKKYAFKCHRQPVDGIDTVFPVNSLAFHPGHGTFASAGGDAMISIWDAMAKKRIRQFARYDSPISVVSYSPDGDTLAVATGWTNLEDGVAEEGDGKIRILLRRGQNEESRPKSKA